MRIPLIAGNWKMFKTKAEALVFAEEFKKLYQGTDVQAAVCAPFTDLEALVAVSYTHLAISMVSLLAASIPSTSAVGSASANPNACASFKAVS